jgi:outer membrane protein OmpA-like peptidoglycan-associated protein
VTSELKVYFAKGPADLIPVAKEMLDRFAIKYIERRVRVTGYTCWIGSWWTNLKLAHSRALTVVTHLKSGRRGRCDDRDETQE